MKASELRIGNKVLYLTSEGIELNIIDWEDLKLSVEDNKYFNEYYKPIPITEEWLRKFGFRKILGKLDYLLGENPFRINYERAPMLVEFNHKEIPIKIKYVHQLQNLYFSLTGIEL